MADIPLFRAGFLLMGVVAAVGAFSLVVLPDERGRDKDDATRVAAPVAAVVASGAAADSAAGPVCRRDAAGIPLPDAVHESSGLAVGGDGNVLWTHNDSGRPVLHAVGLDGRALGQVAVTGAANADWEDLATGPCPGGGRCLYVADIGDNQASRRSITLYRVAEPSPRDGRTLPAEALTATYPDGPQDAEALFVLPDGAVYIVTKGETGGVVLYQLPRTARPGTPATLRRVAELRQGPVDRRDRITGAAASPDGQWLALRTLREVAFHRTGSLSAGSLGPPLTYDLGELEEPQGEAVAFGQGGVVHLSSEGGKKETPATLARLTCSLPRV